MTQFASDLLRRFSASASAVQKQSPTDYRFVPILIFAGLVFSAEATYIALSDLIFPVGILMRVFWVLVLVLCGGMLARHYGLTRTGNSLQTVALAPILSALAVAAMVILTRFTTTFSDDLLAGADRALGVDWVVLFNTFNTHPVLFETARIAYRSFYWQFVVIGPVLFAWGKPAAGSRFLNAWTIALALSVMVYPFFTAEGPYLRYGIMPSDIPNLHSDAPWTTGPIIQSIRDGRTIDVIGSMTGLIFFPSFHAAGAVMFIRAWWQFRWLRWFMLPLNLMLIAAAPVFGLHYFVDLLGGIVVAAVSIILAELLTARIERRACA